jgi:hypothetical protein
MEAIFEAVSEFVLAVALEVLAMVAQLAWDVARGAVELVVAAVRHLW